jgi:hypothetical protein
MKIKLENPVPAKKSTKTVRAYGTSILYVGKRRQAKDLGTSTFPYPRGRKRRARRKTRKPRMRSVVIKRRKK